MSFNIRLLRGCHFFSPIKYTLNFIFVHKALLAFLVTSFEYISRQRIRFFLIYWAEGKSINVSKYISQVNRCLNYVLPSTLTNISS